MNHPTYPLKLRLCQLFCVTMLLGNTQNVIAQDYQPLLDESAHWNYVHQSSCVPFTPIVYRYSVFMNGDTIISASTYKKVYRPFRDWIFGDSTDCLEEWLLKVGYIGALREDITEKKVFYRAPGNEEVLLYDFTLEVGDTLHGHLANNWFEQAPTIQSVDFVEVNGALHKRMIIHDELGMYIIEGIGGTFGFVEPYPFGPLDAPITQFLCWTNEDGFYPENAEVDECNLITNTSPLTWADKNITLYPNPATNAVRVDIPAHWQSKQTKLELHNIHGQLVYEQSNILSTLVDIPVEELPRGMYLLSIQSGAERGVSKLVIE